MAAVLRQPDGTVKGNRLDIIRVLLTVGIVCLHATMTDLEDSTPAFDAFTKGIIWLTKVW